MNKSHYTLEEAHLYQEDIAYIETKLARVTSADSKQRYAEILHVMLEVYTRMQENIRDHGPLQVKKSFWHRLFNR